MKPEGDDHWRIMAQHPLGVEPLFAWTFVTAAVLAQGGGR